MKQYLPHFSSPKTVRSRRSTPATTLITSGSLLIVFWFCLVVTKSSQLHQSSSRNSLSEVRKTAYQDDTSPTQSRATWLVATNIDMEIGYGPLPGVKDSVFILGDNSLMYHWKICPIADRTHSLYPGRTRKKKFLSRWQAENQRCIPCLHCSRMAIDHK